MHNEALQGHACGMSMQDWVGTCSAGLPGATSVRMMARASPALASPSRIAARRSRVASSSLHEVSASCLANDLLGMLCMLWRLSCLLDSLWPCSSSVDLLGCLGNSWASLQPFGTLPAVLATRGLQPLVRFCWECPWDSTVPAAIGMVKAPHDKDSDRRASDF